MSSLLYEPSNIKLIVFILFIKKWLIVLKCDAYFQMVDVFQIKNKDMNTKPWLWTYYRWYLACDTAYSVIAVIIIGNIGIFLFRFKNCALNPERDS